MSKNLPESETSIYRFGVFEFRADALELSRQGVLIRLQAQPARLLKLLLARPGALVSRESIHQLLWPDGTTVDFEMGVNRCIRSLRAALGDDSVSPRYIKTIPGLGYCLIAAVAEQPRANAQETIPPVPEAVPAGQPASIAVLPFANLSDDPQDEYFSDGLAEEITNLLVQTTDLKVIARTSAFAFKGRNEDIRQIAAALGVTSIVEGSVRRSGTRIRVTAQLIRAADGVHLASRRYDSEMNEIFALQDEIAGDIAQQFGSQLAPHARPYPNLEAYGFLLEGRFHWNRLTAAGFAKSAECYQKALALDPNYALAHSGMAEYHFARVSFFFGNPLEDLPKAQAAARRALELDDQLPEPHAVLGCVEATLNYDWALAAQHLECARRLHRGYLFHLGYSVWYLLPLGQAAKAAAECSRVIEHDPLHLLARTCSAFALYCARDFEGASEQCFRALEIDAGFSPALQWLTFVRLAQGRVSEALDWARRALEIHGDSVGPLTAYGLALAEAGDREGALQTAQKVERSGSPFGAARLARIYLLLGDKDAALESLARAIDCHDPHALWSKASGWLNELDSDLRFQTLLARMNLS
jgi:TolB-like protein